MITSARLVIKISAVWIANIVFIEYLLWDNYIKKERYVWNWVHITLGSFDAKKNELQLDTMYVGYQN